jgi:hypothetical protein
MSLPSPTRRHFLILAGGTALAGLWFSRETLQRALIATRAALGGATPPFQVLTAAQAADLEAVASCVIPTDDLPGAREARVIVFLDRVLAEASRETQRAVADGLADLGRRTVRRAGRGVRFAGLAEDDQLALLRDIEHTPFFGQVRALTVIGMFAHPQWGGNFEGAGWRVLGFEPRFAWQPPFGAYDAEAGS